MHLQVCLSRLDFSTMMTCIPLCTCNIIDCARFIDYNNRKIILLSFFKTL